MKNAIEKFHTVEHCVELDENALRLVSEAEIGMADGETGES